MTAPIRSTIVYPYGVSDPTGQPLAPLYLRAILVARGLECTLCPMDPSDPADIIRLRGEVADKDLIGVCVPFTESILATLKVVPHLREANARAHIALGGHGTSFLWGDLLRFCAGVDSVVAFEGEETWTELAGWVAADCPGTPPAGVWTRVNSCEREGTRRSPMRDLDSLPFPRPEETISPTKSRHYTMLSSRGCYGKCRFCESGFFGNSASRNDRWRARSAENVLGEVEQLVRLGGAERVSFIDDDFLGACPSGVRRAREFAARLMELRAPVAWAISCRVDEIDHELMETMRRAGLRRIFLGVDGGSEEDLKLYGKGFKLADVEKALNTLRDVPLDFECGMILYHPRSTIAGIRSALRIGRGLGVTSTSWLANGLIFYPGSPLLGHFGLSTGSLPAPIPSWEFEDAEVSRAHEVLGKLGKACAPIEAAIKKRQFMLAAGERSQQQEARLLRARFGEALGVACERLLDGLPTIDSRTEDSLVGDTGYRLSVDLGFVTAE